MREPEQSLMRRGQLVEKDRARTAQQPAGIIISHHHVYFFYTDLLADGIRRMGETEFSSAVHAAAEAMAPPQRSGHGAGWAETDGS